LQVQPEVCIIELGGTIGDIEGMAFVEAFRWDENLFFEKNKIDCWSVTGHKVFGEKWLLDRHLKMWKDDHLLISSYCSKIID